MVVSPTDCVRQRLQWVHGPRTVVIGSRNCSIGNRARASMGPRSEDRGYRTPDHAEGLLVRVASMGPRSEDRGYRSRSAKGALSPKPLQWVHSPRTVVIVVVNLDVGPADDASMGPRSEDRGYRRLLARSDHRHGRASMGPRSEDRGYRPPPASSTWTQL